MAIVLLYRLLLSFIRYLYTKTMTLTVKTAKPLIIAVICQIIRLFQTSAFGDYDIALSESPC